MEVTVKTNLLVLGYENAQRPKITETTFLHANPNAAQNVLYFLFEKLDATRTKSEFRNCWPILEKKQDADFRKICFSWYKELQIQQINSLPLITASLFQSPGGRKFLRFLLSFTRFVMVQHFHKISKGHCLLELPKIQQTVRAYPSKIRQAHTKLRDTQASLVACQDEARDFVEFASDKFRAFKVLKQNLESDSESFCSDQGALGLNELREACTELKYQTIQQLQTFVDYRCRMDKHFQTILVDDSKRHELDVTRLGHHSVPDTLAKLIQETKQTFGGQVPIPFPNFEPTVAEIQRRQEKFQEHQHTFSNVLLPRLSREVTSLTAKLSSNSGNSFDPPLIPATPGIALDPSVKNSRDGFVRISSLTETPRRSLKEAPIRATDGDVTRRTHMEEMSVEADSFGHTNDLSSMQSASLPFPNPTVTLAPAASTSFLRTSTKDSGEPEADFTRKSVDESKLSCFSPVLSSSRMEPPPFARYLDHSSHGRSPHEAAKVFSSPDRQSPLRQSRASPLRQIQAYRSFLNSIKEHPKQSPLRSVSPLRECSLNTSLVHQSSSSPLLTPVSDKKITSRLNELMNTLVLSDDDSVLENLDLPNFELDF